MPQQNMDAERISFEGSDGLRLVGNSHGDPNAWPVLFLHGSGQTRHAWGRTADTVAQEGWRAITIDQRGHGESDWSPSGDYSLSAFSADCAAVAKQLDKPPVLVGASLGGIAAILAEGTGSHQVSSGLVLVDITPKPNPKGVQRIGEFMHSGLRGFDSLDDAAEAIAAYTPQRKRKTNPEGLHKVLRQRDGRWYWHWDPAFIAMSRATPEPSGPREFLGIALRDIQVPTVLVRGLMSDIVSQEGIDDLFSLIPHATLVDVEGASHMIAGDNNNAFSSAVIDFLERSVRPSLQENSGSSTSRLQTSARFLSPHQDAPLAK